MSAWTCQEESYPFEAELTLLQRKVSKDCFGIVSRHLNTSDDPKLVRMIKMGSWMEKSLGKRQNVPVLDTIGYETFELLDDSDENISSELSDNLN